MLRNLYIKDFAIIKDLEINFTPGLNVLTGETGAGKSILIDAVGQLLGQRANSEFVRTGCNKAFVQGIFELSQKDKIASLLEQVGVEQEDDGTLMLSREISLNGKNKCRINGIPTTLSIFQCVGKNLIDIHGQNSHQSLLSEEKQLILLDSFGGKDLLKLKNDIKELYGKIEQRNQELQELLGYERNGLREQDLLQFQLKEIDEQNFKLNEEDELLIERKILDNAHELAAGCEKINELLYASHDCVYDNIGKGLEILQSLISYDKKLETVLEELNNAIYSVEEVSRTIRDYGEQIEFDSEQLNNINSRLDTINRFKHKYGDSIQDILNYRDEIALSLQKIENSSQKIKDLEAELKELTGAYKHKAEKLTATRREVAHRLQRDIVANLKSLAMPNVQFKIEFSSSRKRQATGNDNICFKFSPNRGEDLKPLSKIASGGEMSRVMLAIKAILARVDDVPVMIFDEIDTGVAGESIKAVAEKLSQLGKVSQVICVTHAAAIAVEANSHYSIKKILEDDRTITKVKKLERNEKITEITRMLGGTEAAEQYARSLILNN